MTQRQQSSVVRETFLWGAFACVLVPVFLVWSGTPLGTALLSGLALAVLGLLVYLALQATGMTVPTAEPNLAPQPRLPEPAELPEPPELPELAEPARLAQLPPPPAAPAFPGGLQPAPMPVPPAPPAPPPSRLAHPDWWSSDERERTYEGEGGWVDDELVPVPPGDARAADVTGTFAFPLFRDEEPDRYR